MTKKDYERAATVVQNARRDVSCPAYWIQEAFVAFFTGDNARFDQERFRKACVPGANVKARG